MRATERIKDRMQVLRHSLMVTLLIGCGPSPEVACNRARVEAHTTWDRYTREVRDAAGAALQASTAAEEALDTALLPYSDTVRSRQQALLQQRYGRGPRPLRAVDDAWEQARQSVVRERPELADVARRSRHAAARFALVADAIGSAEGARDAARGNSAIAARDAAAAVPSIPEARQAFEAAREASERAWQACRDVSP